MQDMMIKAAFYVPSIVAVLATLRVITTPNPVHALLYMVISLIAVAMVFFALGAPFAGVLEVIVYAGAIMVLFVFVVMMLNLGDVVIAQEKQWLKFNVWIGPTLLALILLGDLFYILPLNGINGIGQTVIDAKQVGILLYGPYLLVVELASFLLLAALVAAYHLGRHDEKSDY
jgi:NADH-quinone oxidoreductase subunit J